MPKFVTIGYGDRGISTHTQRGSRGGSHPRRRDKETRSVDRRRGRAGAVRNPLAAGVKTENSAFLSSALPVAGFAVIEAADLAEAIRIVSKTPCAVAHGVVEVWPLEQAG